MWNYQHKFGKNERNSLLVVSIFVVLIASTQAQNQADANPSHVTKQEGDEVELLCYYPQSIQGCNFQFPNMSLLRVHPDVKRPGNFEYHGSGFQDGQCGVKIKQLTKELAGNVSCVIDLGVERDYVYGYMFIEIAKPPTGFEMDFRSQNLQANHELVAECHYNDGNPSAQIKWFLGDEPVQPKTSEYENHNDNNVFVSSVYSKILTPDDDMKLLMCRLEHPALQDGFLNRSSQLRVEYSPLALPREDLYIAGLEIGRNAEIVVRFRANPRPRLQWTVDGKVFKQGQQTDKFVVTDAESVEDGRWQAKLTVIGLTFEDTTKTYTLRADNGVGHPMDYPMRIGGSPDLEGSGPGVVSIIGITIIVLFVLIVVSLLVVARLTKRWCFAGASMHPNSPDSEAQIAPDEDKTHEHYEQHESKVSDEESGDIDHNKKTANGKSNGNTSV